ncbi:hypothetical protein RM780_20135 [Streptomyces sp. DSM 44917]|uniref:Uncharacterized protein n=1 Tax=Streptomyces boetiae TaxID=3075541 RepID=A0ABU2LDB1_9ACTN|nr:hypothetical protein [Streptomyces sp. DSM 44917]MDT0309253.1 hypothetical protein [Streptomyces sp. DSM 44917]
MSHSDGPRRVVRPEGPARGAAFGARPATGERRAARLAPAGREQARPPEVLRAVRSLDAGLDAPARAQLAAWLREHYESRNEPLPLGFVAACHLGPPYVDHRLSLIGAILEHYAPDEAMPEPFSGARMLVRAGAYAYVEVYDNGLLLPVHDDGRIVRTRGGAPQ